MLAQHKGAASEVGIQREFIVSTCRGGDDLVARWPMRLTVRKEQIHKERGRGHPRQGLCGQIQRGRSILGGPRMVRGQYVCRWDDMGESETKWKLI